MFNLINVMYGKSYYVTNRPKRAAAKTVHGKTVYALRQKGTDLYWDGKAPPYRSPGWSTNSPAEQSNWKPKFLDKPAFWESRQSAVYAFHEYELYRLTAKKNPLPVLELMTMVLEPHPILGEQIEIEPRVLEHDRILRHFGLTLAQAYSKLKPEQIGDDPVFEYVIKRKGRSKALIDSAELDEVASCGVYTFARTENDALHVRLLLGENFDKLWCLR